jgi:hypothetical protein
LVDAKARRYLCEDRLLVARADDDGVRARCCGAEDGYKPQVDVDGVVFVGRRAVDARTSRRSSSSPSPASAFGSVRAP